MLIIGKVQFWLISSGNSAYLLSLVPTVNYFQVKEIVAEWRPAGISSGCSSEKICSWPNVASYGSSSNFSYPACSPCPSFSLLPRSFIFFRRKIIFQYANIEKYSARNFAPATVTGTGEDLLRTVQFTKSPKMRWNLPESINIAYKLVEI